MPQFKKKQGSMKKKEKKRKVEVDEESDLEDEPIYNQDYDPENENNDLDYDHTHNLNSPTLSIFGIKGSQIDLSFTKYNTGLYCKFLKDTIFGKDKKVICFNSKPFFSYILSNKVKASFFESS